MSLQAGAAPGRLAVDVGNSEISLGLWRTDGWAHRWRLKTDPGRTADEYRAVLAGLFQTANVHPHTVRLIILASVVPVVTNSVRQACEATFQAPAIVVGPGVRTGVNVRYEPDQSLGPDRLANAVAALELYAPPVVIVDFGTATTLTVVDAAGDVIGGAIAPGVGVAASALAASGARLQRIDLLAGASDVPPAVFGRDTESSMRAGVLHGYAELVEGLIRAMASELPSTPRVVATGGLARLMTKLIDGVDATVPELTLAGLIRIGELNDGPAAAEPETR